MIFCYCYCAGVQVTSQTAQLVNTERCRYKFGKTSLLGLSCVSLGISCSPNCQHCHSNCDRCDTSVSSENLLRHSSLSTSLSSSVSASLPSSLSPSLSSSFSSSVSFENVLRHFSSKLEDMRRLEEFPAFTVSLPVKTKFLQKLPAKDLVIWGQKR